MTDEDARPDLDRIGRETLPAVLDALLGFLATELPPTDHTAGEGSGEFLRATVPLGGPRISGVLDLLAPSSFAEQAVARLLGEAHLPTLDGAEDLVGELGNMIAGQVATRLRHAGYPCELGIPEIVRESEVGRSADGHVLGDGAPGTTRSTQAHAPPTRQSRTVWSCHGHRLTLEIRLGDLPT